MDTSETLIALLAYLAAFLATSLALLAWQRKSFHWARPFAVMMMALAQWSLSLGLEVSSTTLDSMRAWRVLQIIGSSIMPVAWFVFAARYSEHEHLVAGNRRRALYAIPLVTVLLAASNAIHGLLWRAWTAVGSIGLLPSYGAWHLLQVLYSCLLAIAGGYLLWQTLWRENHEQRWHTIVITLGATIPIAGFLLQIFTDGMFAGQNVLPTFLLASVVLLAWTIRHNQILDTVPIARQSVLHNMPDGVIVVNNQDRVVEINPSAERIAGCLAADVLGQRFVEVLPQWSESWYEAIVKGETFIELDLQVDNKARSYSLNFSPVYGRSGRITGRLVILRDITEQKETERELIARRRLFENLVDVARATAEDTSLQATLQNSLDVTTGLTGAEYGSLFLLDSAGRVTHSILARGKTAPGSRRKIVGTVMDQGLAGWAVRNRRTVLVYDTDEDDRWVTFPDQPYTARSVLVVPITSGWDVPGVLTLQHSQAGFFDQEDEALLRAASDQMALALHKAQLFDEQRELARRQQTLYEALKTIGRHLEPATVAHLATETIGRLTDWSAVGMLIPTKDGDNLLLEAANGLLADQEGELFSATRGSIGRTYASGKTHVRLDSGGENEDAFGFIQSTVYVPLQHATSRLGMLVVGVEEAAGFTTDDILLAESLAETVSLAMTNAQLFQIVADEHSRLEALIESSRDGIILVSNERYILFLNHMAISLLGLEGEPEEWLRRPLIDMFSSLGDKATSALRAAEAEILRAANGDLQEGEGEIEINKRALRWQNLPVQTETTTVGRLIVLEDVSKERALQRMREDLTHTMVHDLRNPLNVVSGSLDLLGLKLKSSLDPDSTQLLEIAQQSVGRMLNLVNGILNISRLESGNIPLNRSEVDLPGMIRELLDSQGPLAWEKQIKLESNLNKLNGQSLPELHADVELLERILQNLVGNAIKFTPRQGRISLQVEPRDDEQMLAFSVQDSGPGVPEDIRDQLFQKFVSGTQPEKGSGLGLAFCRMAVEAHGGRIWVENGTEQGAEFAFTLPLVTTVEKDVTASD